MSSLTRRIQKTGSKIGVHRDAIARPSKRLGRRRGTHKRPQISNRTAL